MAFHRPSARYDHALAQTRRDLTEAWMLCPATPQGDRHERILSDMMVRVVQLLEEDLCGALHGRQVTLEGVPAHMLKDRTGRQRSAAD